MRRGLGIHNRRSPGVFNPLSLFQGGIVQGAWYDPSDLTTLFQDSAGTTPVTAVEQPVGLMLDKSKGLVLGSELGASLNSAGSWTAYGSNTVVGSGGEITITFVGGVNSAFGAFASTSSLGLTVGRRYLFEFEVKINTGSATPYINDGVANILFSASSTTYEKKSCRFLYNGAGVIQINNDLSAGEVITFRGFSIREIAGNHAYQTTSASRPTLRARYNLLTYSEQFDNGVWSKIVGIAAFGSGSIVDATTAPDGTTTADLVATATTNSHYINSNNNVSVTSGITYTFSVYLKKGSGANAPDWVIVFFNSAGFGGTYIVAFNLTTIQVGQIGAGISGTPTITDVGNGWRRCVIQAVATATSSSSGIGVGFTNNTNTATLPVYAALSGENVFIWGAQLVPTAVFPSNTYQRVGASTDYATGAAFPPYLAFDGVDDSLLTNSVDFTGTDKMLVVAGVTKNSDAASGMLLESSANAGLNIGAFYLAAPEDTALRYSVYGRGTINPAVGGRADTSSNTYLSPVTNVFTGTLNISGDSNVLRLNGTQIAQATGDQGTGNYGNYPLYIGRRNNASLPFNGNLYSLVIAGQSYAAGQVTSTEQWVAARTPLGSI